MLISLTKFKKSNTNHLVYEKEFKETVAKYDPYKYAMKIFTDGSVIDNRTGCGWISYETKEMIHLPDETSIFTAELYAIQKAIEHFVTTNDFFLILCSDSLSGLQAIKNLVSKNPIVLKIQDLMQKHTEKNFVLIWIPGHCDIGLNEKADELAKNSIKMRCDDQFEIVYSDVKKSIHRKVFDCWQKQWNEKQSSNKFRKLNDNLRKWKDLKHLNRKESKIITRLRLGHTRRTHLHLIERKEKELCICGENFTIEHLFTSCKIFENRRKLFRIKDVTILMEDSIDEYKRIIDFVKNIGLYDDI